MSIVRDLTYLMLLKTIPTAIVLSVCIGVGGCICPESINVPHIIITFIKFSNMALNSASTTDAKIFFLNLAETVNRSVVRGICGGIRIG